MNEKVNNKSIIRCNICNKDYSSKSSLCNHNKKFHNKNKNIMQINANTIIAESKHCENNTSLQCKYCKKIFSHRNSRWKHEKSCKEKQGLITINATEIDTLKNQIKELQGLIVKPTTTNNTNNGTIINNTTNIKISFGEEDMDELTKKDKKSILNAGYSSLVKLIEMVHLNKDLPQYQNIKINNLKDKYAKIYDDNTKNFTTVGKKETIDSLISYRTLDLKSIYKNYNKEDNRLHQCVTKLINKIESYRPDTDDTIILDFYKSLTDELILMIYNKTKSFENQI